MTGGAWRRILFGPDGLRSGWRIVLFSFVMAVFMLVGGLLFSALPLQSLFGQFMGSSVVMLLAALAAGWLLLSRLDKRPPGALGFGLTQAVPRELISGFAIGGLAMVATVVGLLVAGMIRYEPETGTVAGYVSMLLNHLVVLAFAAAAEEAIFRGYPFQALVQGVGPVAATILGSAAFAAAHAWNPDVGVIPFWNLFAAGVLLSIAYLHTRSLWFATAVHLGWNWTMASALDLPVSGLDYFRTPLYEPSIGGPDWITGGAFGPEGGLAATVAFGLALLAVLRLPWVRQSAEMRALRPLVNGRLEQGRLEQG